MYDSISKKREVELPQHYSVGAEGDRCQPHDSRHAVGHLWCRSHLSAVAVYTNCLTPNYVLIAIC